jgi:hypothetical protein
MVALDKIAKRLGDLEYTLSLDWGLNHISGGFVHLQYQYQDKRFIYLTCKSGVQNDVDNDVTEEELKMDVKTLELL